MFYRLCERLEYVQCVYKRTVYIVQGVLHVTLIIIEYI